MRIHIVCSLAPLAFLAGADSVCAQDALKTPVAPSLAQSIRVDESDLKRNARLTSYADVLDDAKRSVVRVFTEKLLRPQPGAPFASVPNLMKPLKKSQHTLSPKPSPSSRPSPPPSLDSSTPRSLAPPPTPLPRARASARPVPLGSPPPSSPPSRPRTRKTSVYAPPSSPDSARSPASTTSSVC